MTRREHLETAIERAITLLDALDGDAEAELEPDEDDGTAEA